MRQRMTFATNMMRCPSCSAPMYREEEREVFVCLSCGKVIPVTSVYGEMFIPGSHRAPTLKGNEIHIEDLVRQKSIRPSRESIKKAYELRCGTLLSVFKEKAGKSPVTFTCPHCHLPVSGRLDQGKAFRCGNCKETISPEESICLDKFSFRLVYDPKETYPRRCLRFKVPTSEAIHLIRDIFRRHRFENRALRNDALVENIVPRPFFIPYVLTDLRIVARCRTRLTKCEYFLDLVNWPLAAYHGLDIFLLDHISRWDFDGLVEFSPENVQKASLLPKMGVFSTGDLVRLMLRERANSAFRKAFDVSLGHLGASSWDLSFPTGEMLALPIYYTQIPLRQRNGLIRIAVNGQNGLTAMVVRRGIHFQTLHYDPYNIHPHGEATMNSIPVAVRPNEEGAVYERLTEEPQAEEEHPFRRLFRTKALRADMIGEPWKHVL